MKAAASSVMIIILSCTPLFAGKIADQFSQSIFGVNWETTLDEVKSLFPQGKIEDKPGVRLYVVKDGRSLFNIERKEKNYIRFHFSPEGELFLVSVEIPGNSFGGYARTLAALEAQLGKAKYHPMPGGGGGLAKWPVDGGVFVSLYPQQGFLSKGNAWFIIERTSASRSSTR